MNKRIVFRALSIILWISIWWVIAIAVNEELLLPSPLSTICKLFELFGTVSFWKTLSQSVFRISFGILIAVFSGILLGTLTGFLPALSELFHPFLSVIKSTPVVSFIVLINLWLNRDTVPIVITVLMVLPVVWMNTEAGIRNVDTGLKEVALLYRLSPVTQWKRLYLPSIYPYLLSACKSSVALGWKAGIAAEIIVLPVISIGRKLYESCNNLETDAMFAWTFTVILLSVFVDAIMAWGFQKLSLRISEKTVTV